MQGPVQQGAFHPDQSLVPPSPFVLRTSTLYSYPRLKVIQKGNLLQSQLIARRTNEVCFSQIYKKPFLTIPSHRPFPGRYLSHTFQGRSDLLFAPRDMTALGGGA